MKKKNTVKGGYIMTVITKINGMDVRETYPEDKTTQEQWNELAEMVAQVLSGKK